MAKNEISRDLVISNLLGIHARPASLFVQTASKFQAEVKVKNLKSNAEADGKSVMSMLMLIAPKGTPIRISVSGPDADQSLAELSQLVVGGFLDD